MLMNADFVPIFFRIISTGAAPMRSTDAIIEKRSAKTSSRTRNHRIPTLPLLPARTSTHRRRAWDLRNGGAGVCMDFDCIAHMFRQSRRASAL